MGKSFNAELYRQLERQVRENDAELSEAERAADMCDFWERIEKEVALVGVGEWHD